MAEVHVLRHDILVRGKSQRQVARELGISRNTVARYIKGDLEPGVMKSSDPRPSPARDEVAPHVEELLEKSRTTRKQKLTAPRVVELLEENGIQASERTVRRVMREWRRLRAEVSVPLEYRPGDLAEVDFFEVVVVVDGLEQKAWMLVVRMMHSGRDFARVYQWQDQPCFLDGHVRAFAHFGCVPERLLYDNLKAAVQRVLVGSERELNARFAGLAAHYGFGPRFARPRRGSDKGGVEARGKAIRWQHLTPMPEGPSLEAINQKLLARLDEKAASKPRERGGPTVADLWPEDAAAALPLPSRAHDPGVLEDVPVSKSARVRVKTAWYSVPCGWHGLSARAWVYADKVVVRLGEQSVEHPRQPANGKHIWYPHYLPELAKKPQAIEQIGDILAVQLGTPFERLWRWLVERRDRRAASRSFKAVLKAILDQGEEVATRAVLRALEADEDPVLATKATEPVQAAQVPEALASMTVEQSSLTIYDSLGGAK